MNDDTLVCTACDTAVDLRLNYDGYHGRCRCSSFYLSPGSEKPAVWERWEDAVSPQNLRVYLDGHIKSSGAVEEDHVACAVCDDRGDIEVTVEDVDLIDHDLKATLRCLNDHYHNGREIREVAYYLSESNKGKALQEMAINE